MARIVSSWLGVSFLVSVIASPVGADPGVERAGTRDDRELGAGLWMVEGEGEEPWLAPQVSTEVHLRVSGLVAHARVEHVFENPSEEAVEALYVSPVPDAAALDALSLQIGARTVAATLRERVEAASVFDDAAQAGRVAALVARERPDVLTTRVANIPPGARVAVTLRYRQLLGARHGALSLELPTTSTPRPASHAAALALGAPGELLGPSPLAPPLWALLTPPVALDGSGPIFDVWVELERGVEPGSVESSSHAIDVSSRGGGLAVRLREGPVLGDRDFVLRWRPPAERALTVSERHRGERYLLAALEAPPGSQSAPGGPVEPAARDVTFVLDVSRSMAGAALAQANAALAAALSRLSPRDRFNVIVAGAPALFDAPRSADKPALEEALARTARLRAAGETRLTQALTQALASPRSGRSEQVVLISDGAVQDERALLRPLEERLGARRVFTVAVGPAPARYPLRALAQAGHGTFTAIGSLEEVAARIAELDVALGEPALEALAPADASARLQPELHPGEPLLVLARLAPGVAGVTLTGRRAGSPWQELLTPGDPGRDARLDRLWAWRELEALERVDDGAASAATRLELARRFGLASALTSFVAVDTERSVEQRAPRSVVPLALPAGSEMFGAPAPASPPGPTCESDPGPPHAGPRAHMFSVASRAKLG